MDQYHSGFDVSGGLRKYSSSQRLGIVSILGNTVDDHPYPAHPNSHIVPNYKTAQEIQKARKFELHNKGLVKMNERFGNGVMSKEPIIPELNVADRRENGRVWIRSDDHSDFFIGSQFDSPVRSLPKTSQTKLWTYLADSSPTPPQYSTPSPSKLRLSNRRCPPSDAPAGWNPPGALNSVKDLLKQDDSCNNQNLARLCKAANSTPLLGQMGDEVFRTAEYEFRRGTSNATPLRIPDKWPYEHKPYPRVPIDLSHGPKVQSPHGYVPQSLNSSPFHDPRNSPVNAKVGSHIPAEIGRFAQNWSEERECALLATPIQNKKDGVRNLQQSGDSSEQPTSTIDQPTGNALLDRILSLDPTLFSIVPRHARPRWSELMLRDQSARRGSRLFDTLSPPRYSTTDIDDVASTFAAAACKTSGDAALVGDKERRHDLARIVGGGGMLVRSSSIRHTFSGQAGVERLMHRNDKVRARSAVNAHRRETAQALVKQHESLLPIPSSKMDEVQVEKRKPFESEMGEGRSRTNSSPVSTLLSTHHVIQPSHVMSSPFKKANL